MEPQTNNLFLTFPDSIVFVCVHGGENLNVWQMVELGGGGPDGPIEHGFSNSVFVVAAAVILPLVGK